MSNPSRLLAPLALSLLLASPTASAAKRRPKPPSAVTPAPTKLAEVGHKALVLGDNIRLRAQPTSKGSGSIGILYKNMLIEVLERSDAEMLTFENKSYPWVRVRNAAGLEGWFNARFLTGDVPAHPPDTFDASPDLTWFTDRYGDIANADSPAIRFNAETFSFDEYRSLIKAAEQGNASARMALLITLYPRLRDGAQDSKSQYFRGRLFSESFLEVMLRASPEDPWVLRFLPKDMMTKDFLVRMIQKGGVYNLHLLGTLPEAVARDREVVLALLKNSHEDRLPLEAEGKHWKDRDFVLDAVKIRGMWLQYASKDLQDDKDVVKSALERNFKALPYVSERLRRAPDVLSVVAEVHTQQ